MLNRNFIISKYLFYIIIFTVNGDSSNVQPIIEYYDFDGIQYVFFSQRVTWEEANMLCLAYNAKLAVLNNMQKATTVAKAMAESNIAMEDAWLGGRRLNLLWIWINDLNSTSGEYKIPIESDIENFPPWSREPLRPTKECLAIDRRSHALPNFIDLDCRLLKSFVCEKKPEDSMNNPIPAKWVQIQKNTYILYHGKVTWTEAVIFCRSQGMRLAVIKNRNIINVLTNSMTKSRPDFENVWIGARFSYGQWMWLSTGSTLTPITNENGYPPWRFGKPEKNSGCLLLDRHLEDTPNFIEMLCDRRRDFICEKYSSEELEEWMMEPLEFVYENITFIIYPFEKTWDESRLYCQERGSTLAYVHNLSLANLMIAAMGDHPKEISHVWLGGLYHPSNKEWRWIYNNEYIASEEDDSGFPPWATSVIETDLIEESSCLNLDRNDHSKPHFYGLDCESRQSFACVISCDSPPKVEHGDWKCYNDLTIKSCLLKCESGFFTMGLEKVNCSSQLGWFNKINWLEFPLCLEVTNYINRIVRSLNQDLQKSSGIYILLSHFNKKMQIASMQFIEKLLTIFPINNYLRMGMTNYATNPKSNIDYKQNDTCTILQLISLMKAQMIQTSNNLTDANKIHSVDWANDILKNNKLRTVIVTIIDNINARKNQEIFERLRLAGHYIITIGLKNDWELLLPITTIGYDQRLNLYLFNEKEFEVFVAEFAKIKGRPLKCTEKSTTTLEPIITKGTTSNPIEDIKNNNKKTIDGIKESTSIISDTTTINNVNDQSTIATSENTVNTNSMDLTTTKNEEKSEGSSSKNDMHKRIYMDREKNRNNKELSKEKKL